MNRKKLTIVCATAVIIAASLIWWHVPTSLINISPDRVSKIEILDGNTGKVITITEAAAIEHIIENLKAVSIKKHKISLGYMGYSFRTKIYRADGEVYKEIIINSSNTIRKDPFFYRAGSGSIDYDYIQKLMVNNSN